MLTRDDLIAKSAYRALSEGLVALDLPAGYYELLDAFTGRLHEEQMTANYVAVGYPYDRDEAAGECGSSLRVSKRSIEFLVFGRTHDQAENLASAMKRIVDRDTLPLLDFNQAGTPEIDRVLVDAVKAARQPIAEPEPWEQFVWLVTLDLTDEFYAEE